MHYGYMYDNKILYNLVDKFFKGKKLGNTSKLTLIQAAQIEPNENDYNTKIFVGLKGGDGTDDYFDNDKLVVDVIMASCAAPFYF